METYFSARQSKLIGIICREIALFCANSQKMTGMILKFLNMMIFFSALCTWTVRITVRRKPGIKNMI